VERALRAARAADDKLVLAVVVEVCVQHAKQLIDAASTCSARAGRTCSHALASRRVPEGALFGDYALWHLSLTERADDETKARYAFVYGEFRPRWSERRVPRALR
jgi:hypothetical protein